MRICVCTPFSAVTEPRAPRHAAALAELFPEADVLFTDSYPAGEDAPHAHPVSQVPGIRREPFRFPTRRNGTLSWLANKAAPKLGLQGAFERHIEAIDADLYFGHGIETLVPIHRAARRNRAKVLFDCMELYAEMGDGQTPEESARTAAAEREWLPKCALVTTTSPRLSRELEHRYGPLRSLSIYNAASVKADRTADKERRFSLYWRNAVVGFGQRGLGDILTALKQLPEEIALHLQGKLPPDRDRELRSYLRAESLESRVTIHPPCQPHEAVKAAGRFHVGLCAERPEVPNHWYTVSNKLFDYHMAGLAIVASGLPGLRDVIDEAGSGLTCWPGDPSDLAARILELYRNQALRERFAASARRYALTRGNSEAEMLRFQNAVAEVCADRWPRKERACAAS